MTQPTTEELKRRSTRALLAHAFFRLESALTVSAAILLAFFLPHPFAWWHGWYWLALGLAGEGLIVWSSITDERTAEHVVADLMREQYDPRTIRTQKYRDAVKQALDYRTQIQNTIASTPTSILQSYLSNSLTGIADWIAHIYTIAQRLDTYERDELLHRDRNQLPESIARYRQTLAAERDPDVRKQIEATIAAKEEQRRNLDQLQNSMEKAQFSLDQTLSSLGTVYSQFQLVRAEKISGGRAQEVSQSINGQVEGLQDIVQAMNQVYGKPV
jgi:hypothetical protein